jgi:hypothetical protein
MGEPDALGVLGTSSARWPGRSGSAAGPRRLGDALDRIEKVHPALGRHLREAVSTGTSCCYTPASPVDWEL